MARTRGRRGFHRVGRSAQFAISKWEHLAEAENLDSAFWVATGAPVAGIHMDPAFLDLVDSDDDNRIITSEVRLAISWVLATLEDKSGINSASDSISPAQIAKGTPAADAIQKIAEDHNAPSVHLKTVREMIASAAQRSVSNEGVVLPEAVEDEGFRGYLADVVAVTGGSPHPSGVVGVASDDGAEFVKRLAAYQKWHDSAPAEVRLFGDQSRDVCRAIGTLGPKIAQYFALCHAVSLSPDLLTAARQEINVNDLAALETRLRSEPLARPRATGALALTEAINPYFRRDIRVIREVVMPVVCPGSAEMREDDWEKIQAAIAPYATWEESKPSSDFDAIPLERLRGYAASDYADRLDKLSNEAANELITTDDLRIAEKLLLYQANILRLANNFVSFPELYDPARRAVFEMGTLVIDGRHLTFSVVAREPEKHRVRVASSGMFVLYAKVYGRPVDENGVRPVEYNVAVPVTAQTAGNLVVGKRGVFYDLTNTEHDAEVTAIVSNPVSIRSALARPFKRVAEAIGTRIDSVAKEAEDRVSAATTEVAIPTAAASPAAPATGLSAMSLPGLLAGGGVAIAAIGSGFAYLTSTLSTIPWWHILIGLGGAVLAVLVPTYLSAMRRIRRRDLSAVLEASGWAINARMRLTRHQSRTFTVRPKP